jgi:crotonobetainyl-CoA:carnitine CoA-transferase CaiB-like acyl-CoA transferase
VKMFSEMEHPTEGRVKVARFPVKFSKTPAQIRCLAPNLGEHTDDILPARAKKRAAISVSKANTPTKTKASTGS